MTPDQIEHAKRQTIEAQKQFPGLTLVSGQHLAGSMYSVMASDHEAETLFPTVMKYRAALRAKHTGESEEQVDERVHNTLKFAEAIGANTSAKSMMDLLDKVQKVENFEGKMIRPEDLLGLSKQAGANLKMLTDQGQKTAIQLVAEWGGDRTGTFLQALGKYSAGSGFDNHASALNELVDAGLVDAKDLKRNKQGNPVGIVSGSASYYRMQGISADPLAFMHGTLVPALERKWKSMSPEQRKRAEDTFRQNYAKEIAEHPDMALRDANGREVDPSKLDAKRLFELNEIRRMFPNAVAARGLGEVLIQMEQFLAKGAKIDKAEGIDATLKTSERDPAAQMQGFQTSLGNFLTVLGGPLMEPAAQGLHTLSTYIGELNGQLAEFQKNNPTAGTVASGAGVLGMLGLGGYLSMKALNGIGRLFGGGTGGAAVAGGTATTGETAVATGAVAAGATGGAIGTGIIGTTLAGIAGAAAFASHQLDQIERAKFGDDARGWTFGRALKNLFGGDDFPTQDEMGAELDRRAKRRQEGNAPPLLPPPVAPETYDGDLPADRWGRPVAETRLGGPPKLEGSLQPLASTVKADVSGTVSGDAELHMSVDVRPSPLLEATLHKIGNVFVPLAGKLGTTRAGVNQPAGIGHQ